METKEKVIKILKALWLAVATVLSIVFIIACIVGGVSNKKQKESVSACVENDIIAYNINNDINKGIKKSVINPSTQAVIHNDESYSITIEVNELNDYTFVNLANSYNNGDFNPQDVTWVYNGSTLDYDEWGANDYVNYYDDGDDVTCGFDLDHTTQNYSRFYISQGGNVFGSFESDLVIICNGNLSNNYNTIKSAIELDIQANQPGSINDSVFETLTNSTVGFIGTISAGITSIMAVFYAESSLTVIGKLSVIVVAVGLTYFLFRLIIGLVRMRG